ncbi:MAG: hypothetical protein AB7E95_07630 [Kiritimatiellales bacterium]
MNRRLFMGIAALTGTVLGAGRVWAGKPVESRCGAACRQCEQYLNKKCGGCGTGEKASCLVFKCNSRRGLTACDQCRAFPCSKHQRINPPESAQNPSFN